MLLFARKRVRSLEGDELNIHPQGKASFDAVARDNVLLNRTTKDSYSSSQVASFLCLVMNGWE